VTPADRAALIARAKSLAIPVASCVAASINSGRLIAECTKAELSALVLVLAEAVDPVRLRAVVAATEDSPSPPPPGRELVLRRAHADVSSLRERGVAVPPQMALLESDYQNGQRQARRERTAAREAEARAQELRDAHAETGRLRKRKEPVPRSLALLDAEYQRDRRQERAAA
jgi:hypothetical protein